jgi:hypothetical protein
VSAKEFRTRWIATPLLRLRKEFYEGLFSTTMTSRLSCRRYESSGGHVEGMGDDRRQPTTVILVDPSLE